LHALSKQNVRFAVLCKTCERDGPLFYSPCLQEGGCRSDFRVNWARTEEFEDAVGVASGAAGDSHDARLLLQDLGVGAVQLLVRHAVHYRHEHLYPRCALLLLALSIPEPLA
jgi:hypothetical protein